MTKQGRLLILAGLAALMALGSAVTAVAKPVPRSVTRATLDNGLRVVIVRNTLAPVVTTEMNYLAGSNEVPKGFPGTAHAVEHMMFRGSPGLSKDQLGAIAANMGGDFNADTTEGVTQYFFTVPASDLDVALKIHAIRMRGVNMDAGDWKKERGAIEQEVSRDNSNPGYKFFTELRERMFKGTPYAHTGLGTRPSFDKTTAKALKSFHDSWYAPNNAILVIAGNVDPQTTLTEVKSLFGDIPRKTIPERPAFNFRQVTAHTVKLPTDYPVGLVLRAWRMPGLCDKDYATAMVLSQALGSKRGDLFAMGMTGKALFAGFSGSFLPQAGLGFAEAAFPRGGDANKVLKGVDAVMANAVAKGIPADLVAAAKNKAIASLEFQKNSVSGLANAWSQALAYQGVDSPSAVKNAIEAVTPAGVNALAKRIFKPEHAITAILTPQSSGKPVSHKGFGGAESFASKPNGPVVLPDWARQAFAKLAVPQSAIHPESFTLDNGLRVIVQPESVSKTVEVYGQIKTNQDMQAPAGSEGVAGVLNGLFNFGSTHLGRLQYQQALDAISASESGGSSFSLKVPVAHFAQGMKLLADNELHPAMPQRAFMVMQHNQAGAAAGTIKSPGFLNSIHLDRALYPKDDPGLRYATPKSVKSLKLTDVKNYYGKTFRPDMTTIVIVGDVSEAQARKAVETSFGHWQASGAKPKTDYPAVPMNKPSQFNTPDSAAVQDSVTLAHNVELTYNSPDRFAVQLGNQVLSGGALSSRLWRDLRVRNGLVYGVRSGLDLDRNRGQFDVNYGCDPDKVAEARAMVVRDIKQMQNDPVTADELHTAKGMLLRRIALGESSFGSIGARLLNLSLQGKPLDSYTVAAHKYMELDAPAIEAAFKKYLKPDDFVTAVKGPAPKG
ncbi:MAG: pitrilysin family protein [Rhodanobacteraceae bacterium]